jgi:putative nucleotidyltransferase with HDIG domain
MPESPTSQQMRIPPERSERWRRASDDPAREALAHAIPRRAAVSWWLAIVLALGFAAVVTPAITAERWLLRFQPGAVAEKQPAPFTVRAPMLAGYDQLRVGGGVVVARGEIATRDEATIASAIAAAMPRGPALYAALFALSFVLALLFSHHLRRSTKGRLVRVQVVSLAVIAVLAIAAKLVLLATALSALAVPVALLAIIPTMALARVVGLATGVLAALVVSLLAPFDVGLAILLLAQAVTAGLVVAERPKRRWTAALSAGLVTTLCTGAMYLLLTYLTTGRAPELRDPLHSAWLAALIGPAIAAVAAVPLLPLYQLLVGEITQGKLFALEDLSHPLLRQIAEKSPGTWQHSLMMANMAEIAANAIGANGRLVRVGAYFHDLGKSLSPKYFIENLEAGETSPHDQLPPEISCDAIFAHVSEGIAAARKAGLHERIVDFMHMHHGNGVLEYFWAKCREQGNPQGYTIEQFRYPGHPPQSRETAILTICDAVEAASRTLKKPDATSIDSLVQRIVYGKLHLGQLDESGLSMSDLRRISDSLRETIRHANHGRIEYPWQKAEQDASASAAPVTSTAPRLDSLDRKPARDSAARPSTTPARTSAPVRTPASADAEDAFAATADLQPSARAEAPGDSDPARVRPGTARNASGRRAIDGVALGRSPRVVEEVADDDTGRVARGADPGDRAALAMVDTARAATPKREVAVTRPGLAPGPSGDDDSGLAPTLPPDNRSEDAPITLPSDDERTPITADAGSERAPITLPSDDERAPVTPDASSDRAPLTLNSDERTPSTRDDSLGTPLTQNSDERTPITRDDSLGAPLTLASDDGPAPIVTASEDGVREPSAATAVHVPGPPPPSDLITPETFGDLTPAARKRAATLPAMPLRRPPTAPPPVVSRRVEPSRTAGPPEPVDLENAITNPPPMRRGPGGQPAMPQDPAEIAAALAAIVSRVSAAPFGGASAADAAAGGSRDIDDNATTIPPPMRQTPPAGPALATSPALLAGSARAPDDADSAVTQPSMPVTAAPVVADARSASTTAHPRPSTAPTRRTPTASPVAVLRLPAPVADERITRPRPAVAPRGDDDVRMTAPHETVAAHALEPGPDASPDLATDLATGSAIASSPPTGAAAASPSSISRSTIIGVAAAPPSSTSRSTTPGFAVAFDPTLDAGVTEPSLPVLSIGDQRRDDAPPRPGPPTAPPGRKPGWASGLAARIDAAIEGDDWGPETPVAPPTKAELRALTGNPDPTRRQPVDELQLLQRRAAELVERDARRSAHPTAEVDPDDIEAAIEVAPPARRPTNANAIGASKPKKSE